MLLSLPSMLLFHTHTIAIHRTSTESRTKEKSTIVSFCSAVYSCLRQEVFHDCAVLWTLLLSCCCPYIMVLCSYQAHTLYIHRHGAKENPNIVSFCSVVYNCLRQGAFHDFAVLWTLLLPYYCPYITVLRPYQVHTLYIHRHGTQRKSQHCLCVCHHV